MPSHQRQQANATVDGCQHFYRLERFLVKDEMLGYQHVCEMTSLDEQRKAERQNARLSGGKDQEIIDWISMSSVPWNARFAPKLMKIILGGTQALKRMKPVFSGSTE